MALICSICQINPVKLPMATTCSLECACRLNGDDYNAVFARVNQAIADGVTNIDRRVKRK